MSFSKSAAIRIARAEITISLRDWRTPLALSFLAIALTLTTWHGVRDFRASQSLVQSTAGAEYDRWLNQGSKSAHSAAHFGQFVFPPRLPLSALESGTHPYTGAFVFLEAHTQKLFQFRPAEDKSFLFRFASVDSSFVMGAIGPLLLVLLLFSSIAGERESGTLLQLLASGVSTRSIAAGKVIAALCTLSVILIPYFLITSGLTLSLSSRPADDGIRLMFLFLSWLAGWWIFAALSVVLSARARSPRQALLWLLPLWFTLCFVAPPLAAWVSGLTAPSMDGLTFAAAIQSDRYTLPVWYERLDATEKRLLAQYSVSELKALPVSPAGIGMVEDEDAYDRLQEKRFNALYGVWEQQAQVYGLIGLVAPPLAVSSVSMAMAGSDFPHNRHFAIAAEQYRQYFVQTMNQAMVGGQRPDALPYAPGYSPGAELWRTIRPFEYDLPPVSWALQRAALPIACLALWSMAAFAFFLAGVRTISAQ